MTSVLQDWVTELPLRAQGTLLTGIRGCDETPKLPLDSTARTLTAFFRWTVMNPADPREVDREPGCFHQTRPPEDWKASELGHLPQHYYAHLMHCFEVVWHWHPEERVRDDAGNCYLKMVHSLHLNAETYEQLEERLTEDRIATGNVVS